MTAARSALSFIKAELVHLNDLREIAYHSERYWGFSDEFMEIFEKKFNITERFLEKNPVYIGMEMDMVQLCGGI